MKTTHVCASMLVALAGLVAGALAGCSESGASVAQVALANEPEYASRLELRVERSFRERGVRKTVVFGETTSGPVRVSAIRSSPGIRLPEIPLPLEVGERLVLELEWLDDAREGSLVLRAGAMDEELVVDVSYE